MRADIVGRGGLREQRLRHLGEEHLKLLGITLFFPDRMHGGPTSLGLQRQEALYNAPPPADETNKPITGDWAGTTVSANIIGPGTLKVRAPHDESLASTDFRLRCIPWFPFISCRTHMVESFASEDGEEPNFPGRERTLARASQDGKGELQ
jgi:hypothetical protein